jgi:hypothetical protein
VGFWAASPFVGILTVVLWPVASASVIAARAMSRALGQVVVVKMTSNARRALHSASSSEVGALPVSMSFHPFGGGHGMPQRARSARVQPPFGVRLAMMSSRGMIGLMVFLLNFKRPICLRKLENKFFPGWEVFPDFRPASSISKRRAVFRKKD